jgi:predicted RNase H-like HicB family nuclease
VKNRRKFTVPLERDEEGYYLATVPSLRGCHTQAKTLDTLMKRTLAAIAVCLASEDGVPSTKTQKISRTRTLQETRV